MTETASDSTMSCSARSAECSADGELAGAIRSARDVEATEIDAGGEQNQGGEEHQRGEEAAQRATKGIANEAQGRDAEGGIGLVGRVFVGERLRNAVEISLRLTCGDCGETAAHDPDVLIAAIVDEAVALDLLLVPEIGPEVGADEALAAGEVRTCYAENDEGLLRDADGAANDAGVTGEVGLPGGVAENDVGATVGAVSVVAVMEEAAEERGDAERVKVAAGGLEVPARLGVAIGGETDLGETVGADGRKGTVAGAEIEVIRKGHRDAVVLAMLNEGELAGLGDGGGPEEARR
jgi:hypothetical protein